MKPLNSELRAETRLTEGEVDAILRARPDNIVYIVQQIVAERERRLRATLATAERERFVREYRDLGDESTDREVAELARNMIREVEGDA